MLYMMIADGELDQVCETEATMRKEKRDLEKLGCAVVVKRFESWDELTAYEAKRWPHGTEWTK